MIDQIKPLASIFGAGLMMLGLIGPPAPTDSHTEPAVRLANDWSDVTDVAVVDEVPATDPAASSTVELKRLNDQLSMYSRSNDEYTKQLSVTAEVLARAAEQSSGGFQSSGGLGANWDAQIAKVAKETAEECKYEGPTIDEIRAVVRDELDKPRKYESIMPTSMQYTSPAGNPASSNGSAGGSTTFANGSMGGSLVASGGSTGGYYNTGSVVDYSGRTPLRNAALPPALPSQPVTVPSQVASSNCYTDANGNMVCPANRSPAASNDGWYLGKFLGR